ncbi:PAS domain S-box protein [Pleionea sediminis]|uniref:PAS domain S-box protein n=1 Tax=Pleionea sediminis TaxID=2569479 RepID=UPI0013DD87CF|nr:PAS domain S-box protein [Pleionea sediminis]
MNSNQITFQESLTVLETSNVMICTVDQNGYFVYLNPSWTENLGWSIEELKRKPFANFLHPDDIEISKQAAQSVFSTKQEVKFFTNRYRTNSGNYRTFEWSARLSDSLNLIIATATDITDKEKLRRDSKFSSQVLSAAADVAHLGYWKVDLTSQSVEWSDEVYRIHGVTRDTYRPTLESALNFYHPDDFEKVKSLVTQALKSQKEYYYQKRIVRPGGEIRHVVAKGVIERNENNVPKSVFGVFQDITEIQQIISEKDLLSKVAEYTITGIVVTDYRKKVLWVNQAFEAMTGYNLEEVHGKSLGQFLQGEKTNKETITEIKERLAQEKHVNVEILNYHKKGFSYWNHLYIAPVIQNGNVTHFIGIQHDITKQKEHQDIIARMQRMDTISELAAGIAHDFNNLLAIIEGNRELIEMKAKQLEVNEHLSKMKSAISRATQTTQKLLKSSKKSSLEKTHFNANVLLNDLMDLLNEAIPNNISLTWEIDSECLIKISRSDLEDSITNIIINACNAIEHHGTVTIKSSITHEMNHSMDGEFIYIKASDSQRYCRISIRDDGCGIDESHLEEIFLPFVSLSPNKTGTGLGLSMVAGFAAREGLGISINSKPDMGTEFNLWLPISEDLPQEPQKLTVSPVINLSEIHAVLIDDEMMLLETSHQLLESMGINVRSFLQPSEGLSYIDNNLDKIDIILTDEIMPGEIQGHNIYQKYHTLKPVIIISGYEGNLPESLANVTVIKKPFDRMLLQDSINEAIGEFNEKSF